MSFYHVHRDTYSAVIPNFYMYVYVDERFEYARKLKLCMTVLRCAGERMGRYALAKRQAVQQEDFTTAKLRKEQIEMYKNIVFEQLQVEMLLERNGVCIIYFYEYIINYIT